MQEKRNHEKEIMTVDSVALSSYNKKSKLIGNKFFFSRLCMSLQKMRRCIYEKNAVDGYAADLCAGPILL